MLKEILCESMESPDDRAVGFGAERIFRRPHSPRRGRPNASLGCQPGDRSPNTPLYLIRGLGPASEDVGPRPRIRWVADAQGAARTAHLGIEIDGLPSIQRAPTPPPCATVSPNRVFDEPASRFVNPTPPGPRPANACDLGLAAQRRPDVSPGCRQSRNPGSRHTTGRTVFRIRRLDPAALATRRKTGRSPQRRPPPVPRASLSVGMDATLTLAPTGLGSPRLHRFCLRLLPVSFPSAGKDFAARDSGKPLGRDVSRSSSLAPWSFGPSLQRHYPPSSLLWPLLTSPPLSPRSPPQVRCCFFPFMPSGSTALRPQPRPRHERRPARTPVLPARGARHSRPPNCNIMNLAGGRRWNPFFQQFSMKSFAAFVAAGLLIALLFEYC